jgi:hypothetical protein
MKPIHKAAGKEIIRKIYNYIQIKAGFAYATNCYKAIKMPVEELFPKGIIEQNEEIYFEAALWASAKMDKAHSISRDGLHFTAKDKNGNITGIIKALDAKDISGIGRFPDVTMVLPNERENIAIDHIGFDPAVLTELCASFGLKTDFYYKFFGVEKGIVIRHLESKAVGIIMPLHLTGKIKEAEA